MKKVLCGSALVLAACMFLATAGFAKDQDKVQDRKKDGSCVSAISLATPTQLLAAAGTCSGDQDRNRDKAKDGSCQA